MTNLNFSSSGRWGFNGLVLLGLSMALYQGRMVFIPLTIALLLAGMLWPAVKWLNERGIPLPGLGYGSKAPWILPCLYRIRVPWALACGAAVIVLVAGAISAAVVVGLAIPRVIQSLPNDPQKSQKYYERFRARVAKLSPTELDPTYFPEKAEDSEIVKYIQGALNPDNPQYVINSLISVLGIGANYLWQSILIMFILLFLLLEGQMLTRRLVALFGTAPEVRARTLAALAEMGEAVRSYLVWRTVINLVMAVILGSVYYLAGLSQPWVWALVSIILLYVPYIGTIMAGVPPVIDAMVTCESPLVAVGILVFYCLFTTVEGYFIVPVVMGRSMELNATTVMLSCLFWELVWGWAGLFLAMPLMAGIKAICYQVPEWRPWARLLDVGGPEPDEDQPPTVVLPPSSAESARTEKIERPEKN